MESTDLPVRVTIVRLTGLTVVSGIVNLLVSALHFVIFLFAFLGYLGVLATIGIIASSTILLLIFLLLGPTLSSQTMYIILNDIRSLFFTAGYRPWVMLLTFVTVLVALLLSTLIKQSRFSVFKAVIYIIVMILLFMALVQSSDISFMYLSTSSTIIVLVFAFPFIPIIHIIASMRLPLFGSGVEADYIFTNLDYVAVIAMVTGTVLYWHLLGDALVLLAGSLASSRFRRALWDNLRLPHRRTSRFGGRPRLKAILAAMWRLFGAVLLGIIIFCTVVGTFAVIGCLLFITPHSFGKNAAELLTTAATSVGVVLQSATAIWLALYGPFFLAVMAAAIVLARTPVAPLLVEWIIVIVVGLFLTIALNGGEANGTEANHWVALLMPSVLGLTIFRSIVWNGTLMAWTVFLAIQQKTVDDSQPKDLQQPILYLRAFKDDRQTSGGPASFFDILMGRYAQRRRFEQMIAQRAFLWRPVIALGNPHLPVQLHGVLKRQVSDQDWQAEVETWRARASYIIMIANQTDNIAWEIALIQSSGAAYHTIYIVTNPAMVAAFFTHYSILGYGNQARIPPQALAIYHDPLKGWTALTSAFRTPTAYVLALDIAIAALERKVVTGSLIQNASY